MFNACGRIERLQIYTKGQDMQKLYPYQTCNFSVWKLTMEGSTIYFGDVSDGNSTAVMNRKQDL